MVMDTATVPMFREQLIDRRQKLETAIIDADEDAEDTWAGRAEDVEELWECDYVKRERRRDSREDEGDGDGPGAKAADGSRKSGRVSGLRLA